MGDGGVVPVGEGGMAVGDCGGMLGVGEEGMVGADVGAFLSMNFKFMTPLAAFGTEIFMHEMVFPLREQVTSPAPLVLPISQLPSSSVYFEARLGGSWKPGGKYAVIFCPLHRQFSPHSFRIPPRSHTSVPDSAV